ncbi:type II secretion system protein GspC [Planctobacterium marinum]|uniref:type II secretion system protein GspC n=1 Tax=Planctobacterium marinum TaxID=1631968 RepID=UPI001E60C036|nr:type II secretion system protein GspC [Planctobacterium marinum]MCC2606497.1 type II secretion system protein GspC [Planctobacterium marinum]
MATAQITTDQLWSIWQKHQKTINLLVVILLSIYLLAYAAELFWRLFPEPESDHSQVAVTQLNSSNSKKQQTNIDAIKRLKLFGDPGAVKEEVKQVVQDAPETQLNLTLTGLVASTEEQDGAAIIENRGEQNTYGIGEKVDGTRAVVKEVMPDRIIIDNGGRMETLMLDGHDFKQASATVKSAGQIRQGPVNAPQDRLRKPAIQTFDKSTADAARALRESPTKFTDFIAIQPHREEGKIAGYKVNPGKDPALFEAAGLQANDILTEINGLDLTDIQQSMEAMKMLRSAEFLQIKLSRDGAVTTLDLELPASAGN